MTRSYHIHMPQTHTYLPLQFTGKIFVDQWLIVRPKIIDIWNFRWFRIKIITTRKWDKKWDKVENCTIQKLTWKSKPNFSFPHLLVKRDVHNHHPNAMDKMNENGWYWVHALAKLICYAKVRDTCIRRVPNSSTNCLFQCLVHTFHIWYYIQDYLHRDFRWNSLHDKRCSFPTRNQQEKYHQQHTIVARLGKFKIEKWIKIFFIHSVSESLSSLHLP